MYAAHTVNNEGSTAEGSYADRLCASSTLCYALETWIWSILCICDSVYLVICVRAKSMMPLIIPYMPLRLTLNSIGAT